MKIFITGATGFIGAAFARAAIDAAHDVSLLLRDPDSWRIRDLSGRYRLVQASLAEAAAVRAALEEIEPEVVVHLGWAGVSGGHRNDSVQIANIGWSADLMDAATAAGTKHFISTGSQAEYGPQSGVISPDADTHPTTLYGEAKLATFRLLVRLAAIRQVRFSWLRVFSTYGAQDHPYWMIPGLIRALLAGERPALTEGRQRWDFLHVKDAAAAILSVAESSHASGVYNLGSGSAPPLRDTISMVRDAIDPSLPLGFGDVPYRPDQVMHLQADTERLNNELDWHPQIKLSDGLVDTVSWYRANPWIFG